jgi:hypothetical protein
MRRSGYSGFERKEMPTGAAMAQVGGFANTASISKAIGVRKRYFDGPQQLRVQFVL